MHRQLKGWRERHALPIMFLFYALCQGHIKASKGVTIALISFRIPHEDQ
jgi:hypothetical protein